MNIDSYDPEDDEQSGDYERRDGGDTADRERERTESSGHYDRYGKKRDPLSEF